MTSLLHTVHLATKHVSQTTLYKLADCSEISGPRMEHEPETANSRASNAFALRITDLAKAAEKGDGNCL
jgi:hypothetical protein